MSKAWIRWLALLAVGVGIAGLAWGAWELLRPKQVTYLVTVLMPDGAPAEDVRLLAGPSAVAPLQPAKYLVPGLRHRRLEHEVMQPDLRVERLGPCGWQPVAHEVVKAPDREVLEAAFRVETPVSLDLRIGPRDAHAAQIWVDNRGGGEAELAMGQLSRKIAAGAARRLDLPIADCEEGTTLRLDGREIGRVPVVTDEQVELFYTRFSLGHPDVDESTPSWIFLVDTSGQRCYLFQGWKYGDWWGTGPAGGEARFRAKLLHRLPPTEVDYFLERAPTKIEVETHPGTPPREMRHHLIEEPC